MKFVLAFHLIGMVLWIGGLMTFSRLVGHHARLGPAANDTLLSFQKKSYFIGVLPGGLLTIVMGLGLLMSQPGGMKHYLAADGPWGITFHVKLSLVLFIFISDIVCFAQLRKLSKGESVSRGLVMALHGLVALAFIAIVLLVKGQILVS